MKSGTWWYERSEQKVGPFTRDELARLIQAGLLTPDAVLVDQHGGQARVSAVLGNFDSSGTPGVGPKTADLGRSKENATSDFPPPPPLPGIVSAPVVDTFGKFAAPTVAERIPIAHKQAEEAPLKHELSMARCPGTTKEHATSPSSSKGKDSFPTTGEYYVLFGKERRGPFTLEELLRQQFRQDTLVWREGFTSWVLLRDVPELRERLPPPIPIHAAAQPSPPESRNAASNPQASQSAAQRDAAEVSDAKPVSSASGRGFTLGDPKELLGCAAGVIIATLAIFVISRAFGWKPQSILWFIMALAFLSHILKWFK